MLIYKNSESNNVMESYYLRSLGMGYQGEPEHSPHYSWCIGVGRYSCAGFSGYMSISTFLSNDTRFIPTEAKEKCVEILSKMKFDRWLMERGFMPGVVQP